MRSGVSSGLSGVNAGVGVGEVLLDEPDKLKFGVVEVLFAWDGDSDPLTDERMETKRGRKGNAGRKGNVSNCAKFQTWKDRTCEPICLFLQSNTVPQSGVFPEK